MKIVTVTCPNCGASIQVDADKKNLTCNYCGNYLYPDDVKENESQFEEGKQRARNGNNWVLQKSVDKQQPKKRKTWLWVLGWICIFPIPLTILMLRNKKMNQGLKYGIIAVSWILYLLIGLSANSGNDGGSTSARDNSSSERSISAANSNIKKLSFSKNEDRTVKIGGNTSESYVLVEVKDKDAFSPEDVVFVSENPAIATIEFTKDALTTHIYYKITGISAGETYVYATSSDGSVSSEKVKVIVEGSSSNINSLDFASFDEVVVKVGQDSDLGVLNVELKNTWEYSDDDIIFISDDPEIAEITFEESSHGRSIHYKIHGNSAGQTTVYAQSNDGIISSSKLKVTVPEPVEVESINFGFEEMTLGLGESTTVAANILPENADDTAVKWSSSDSSVATIDEEGTLSALGGGTTVITAESNNGKTASFNLIVDGSRRMMRLRVTHPREDSNHIGDEWSYYNAVNGEIIKGEYSIGVGDTLSFYSKYTESDDNPDVGEASYSYTVTEEDIQNGFTITMDVYVQENGGKNSGKSAHFVATYTFSVK